MKIAVVGVTGMVGQIILDVLKERNFPVSELIPVASERSVGSEIEFGGKIYKIVSIETAFEKQPNIALFSAGGDLSREWAKKFAENGCRVIDNSSAFRMDADVPLIVPEINGDLLTDEHYLISNPNCSTTQLVMVLNPIHKKYKIKRVIVSNYKSVNENVNDTVLILYNEIYNSYTFRIDANVHLIVPEINGDLMTDEHYLISNPNCSTTQLVMVLNPIHKKYKIKRVIVSTYQSVTGTGKDAVEQLENEIAGKTANMVYPYPIFKNAIPHCDTFDELGYTKEELKLMRETQKILDDRTIAVTATAVRVAVQGGHSESVNLELRNPFELTDLRKLLHQTEGVTLQDNTDTNTYPMPIYAEGKDDVFVGRIRRDLSQANSLNMWIVSDNLRKGAATNTVQIAEYLLKNNLV